MAHLVVGSDGLIGGAILRELELRRAPLVLGTSRREQGAPDRVRLDLAAAGRDRAEIDALVAALPRNDGRLIVILAAAVTGFQQCEQAPDESRLANVAGTVSVAEALADRGAFVVFLSSNAVFDGRHPLRRESDATSPTTEYGRQKAEAESALFSLRAPDQIAAVRLTKVLSYRQPLVGGWVDRLDRGEVIDAATDLRMSPITLGYAARGIVAIADAARPGVYHLSGTQDVSYYELAVSLAERAGRPRTLVRPTSIRAKLGPIPSPEFGTLDMERTERATGIRPQALASVADDLVAEATSLRR